MEKGSKLGRKRVDWVNVVIPRAKAIVKSYDTPVTLRQLFYRLVSEGLIANSLSMYSNLSRVTAAARREGTFPALIEAGRPIHQYQTFTDPDDARDWLASIYRRDRTEGQAVQIILGVEKAGIVEQLSKWFGEFGFPIVALSGYSSVTLETALRELDESHSDAGTVLIYAGDLDPSGEQISENLAAQLPDIAIVRIGLSDEQIVTYNLVKLPGKATDPRAEEFARKHGGLYQVELDALDPNVLRDLYKQAILAAGWRRDLYDQSGAREELDRAALVS